MPAPLDRASEYIARGQASVEKKDFARANLEFRSAMQVLPNDAEPYQVQQPGPNCGIPGHVSVVVELYEAVPGGLSEDIQTAIMAVALFSTAMQGLRLSLPAE